VRKQRWRAIFVVACISICIGSFARGDFVWTAFYFALALAHLALWWVEGRRSL